MRNKHFRVSMGIMILLSFISVSAFLFWSDYAQPLSDFLPDLIVTRIECFPPQSKLSFTVTNRSNVPLPKGWLAVAKVSLPGGVEQIFDLRRPTSGNIEPAGGSASYLLPYEIKVTVKVLVDSTNSIKESNEGNNEKVQSFEFCPR